MTQDYYNDLLIAQNCQGLQNAICNAINNCSFPLTLLREISLRLVRQFDENSDLSEEGATQRIMLSFTKEWKTKERKTAFEDAVKRAFNKPTKASEVYKRLVKDFPELNPKYKEEPFPAISLEEEHAALLILLYSIVTPGQAAPAKVESLRQLASKVLRNEVTAILAVADARKRDLL